MIIKKATRPSQGKRLAAKEKKSAKISNKIVINDNLPNRFMATVQHKIDKTKKSARLG